MFQISEDDGLPSGICAPCMWRMIEFEAYKRNVIQAEAELKMLKRMMNPVSTFEDKMSVRQVKYSSK